jgi:hypothetical protein
MKQSHTERTLRKILSRIVSGEESPEDCAKYRHIAGEISAHGARCAEAIQRREVRREPPLANAPTVPTAGLTTTDS